MTTTQQPEAEAKTYNVIDAETGEVYGRNYNKASGADRGWLLRSRTSYYRRTGHRLVVAEAPKTEEG
jgi:hypothetical protein